MEITITRCASSADLACITALAPDIWRHTYRKILGEKQISYMLKLMYAPEVLQKESETGTVFALIRCDGTARGFLAYHEITPEDGTVPDTLKLEKLYLDPGFHGLGIGSKALQHVIQCATDAGYRYVILNVNKQNIHAQRAYRRNGFKRWKEEVNPIGNGMVMDDFVMRCTL